MDFGSLSSYFVGVGYKRLTAVEVDPVASNQHEFQGVTRLKGIFGTDNRRFQSRGLFASDDDDQALSADGRLTWYDARANANAARAAGGHPIRSPEFHFYYDGSLATVVHAANAGDLLVVGLRPNGDVNFIIAAEGSSIEQQVIWLFGLSGVDFEPRLASHAIEGANDREIDVTAAAILERLGIELEARPNPLDEQRLTEKYGFTFPSTFEFSAFARSTLDADVFRGDPDVAMLLAYRREEELFYTLERLIVDRKVQEGFRDVEDFLSFSMSVHQRRRSRVGYALEHHLSFIFRQRHIEFQIKPETERSRPDFLFPNVEVYRSAQSGDPRLKILAVKSTCKDRWRQVLTEADKIPIKHLFTLEAPITANQTEDMRDKQLRLVVPAELHGLFTFPQRQWLMRLSDFMALVSARPAG